MDPVLFKALLGAVGLLVLYVIFSLVDDWWDRRRDSAALDYTSEVPVGSEAWVPTPAPLEPEDDTPKEYAPQGVRYFRGTMITCPSCEAILARAIRHVYKGEQGRNVVRAFLPEKHYESNVLHECPECGAGTARWDAKIGAKPVIELHTDTGWQ